MGVLCCDCHMPMLSGASAGTFGSGTRHTHIFKINPGALVSTDSSNWTMQASSSGKATKY